jgi:hypothetical protein
MAEKPKGPRQVVQPDENENTINKPVFKADVQVLVDKIESQSELSEAEIESYEQQITDMQDVLNGAQSHYLSKVLAAKKIKQKELKSKIERDVKLAAHQIGHLTGIMTAATTAAGELSTTSALKREAALTKSQANLNVMGAGIKENSIDLAIGTTDLAVQSAAILTDGTIGAVNNTVQSARQMVADYAKTKQETSADRAALKKQEQVLKKAKLDEKIKTTNQRLADEAEQKKVDAVNLANEQEAERQILAEIAQLERDSSLKDSELKIKTEQVERAKQNRDDAINNLEHEVEVDGQALEAMPQGAMEQMNNPFFDKPIEGKGQYAYPSDPFPSKYPPLQFKYSLPFSKNKDKQVFVEDELKNLDAKIQKSETEIGKFVNNTDLLLNSDNFEPSVLSAVKAILEYRNLRKEREVVTQFLMGNVTPYENLKDSVIGKDNEQIELETASDELKKFITKTNKVKPSFTPNLLNPKTKDDNRNFTFNPSIPGMADIVSNHLNNETQINEYNQKSDKKHISKDVYQVTENLKTLTKIQLQEQLNTLLELQKSNQLGINQDNVQAYISIINDFQEQHYTFQAATVIPKNYKGSEAVLQKRLKYSAITKDQYEYKSNPEGMYTDRRDTVNGYYDMYFAAIDNIINQIDSPQQTV